MSPRWRQSSFWLHFSSPEELTTIHGQDPTDGNLVLSSEARYICAPQDQTDCIQRIKGTSTYYPHCPSPSTHHAERSLLSLQFLQWEERAYGWHPDCQHYGSLCGSPYCGLTPQGSQENLWDSTTGSLRWRREYRLPKTSNRGSVDKVPTYRSQPAVLFICKPSLVAQFEELAKYSFCLIQSPKWGTLPFLEPGHLQKSLVIPNHGKSWLSSPENLFEKIWELLEVGPPTPVQAGVRDIAPPAAEHGPPPPNPIWQEGLVRTPESNITQKLLSGEAEES